MLEFYPANCVDSLRRPSLQVPAMRMTGTRIDARAITIAVAAAFVATGCATAPIGPAPATPSPQAPPLPRTAEPPPPSVNLSGFPLPYRQGYADGCASAKGAERKDAERFGADPNYRTGWMDGIALCQRK
jgi:hypothetical protein